MAFRDKSTFGVNPKVDIQRSTFNRSSQHKTTFNAGDLIPILCEEVLPGDTFNLSTSFVIRESTLIHPVMDNSFLDIFYFFVPSRLLWEHWVDFNGENTKGYWFNQTQYTIPQITAPIQNGWVVGTVADYFGIPTQTKGLSVNALPFRAYTMIWNEWFRDQNLQAPSLWLRDDATIEGTNGKEYLTDPVKGGFPLKVNKYHDYFTSCLPSPQKGPSVLIPSLYGLAPVGTTNEYIDMTNVGGNVMKFNKSTSETARFVIGTESAPSDTILNATFLSGSAVDGLTQSVGYVEPVNLWADMSSAQQGATINDLRNAFQIQRMYERDARGGTRYTEIIKSHFGVDSPDSRLQRPEYLGGHKQPIQINQVLQTSSTDETSPQGNTSAFSLTSDNTGSFVKSFVEHGFVIGLASVRTEHTYQQGLERFWSRKNRTDFYLPVFANLGEQPVYNREIYAQGNAEDDQVFGYNEAWADYRYKPSRVSGTFRSSYETPLDSWHYADYYKSRPTLSSTWIPETLVNIDRTLAVQSSVQHQFIVDFYFHNVCSRPMPMYSVPGFIDRN